jgi:hypothetical protein
MVRIAFVCMVGLCLSASGSALGQSRCDPGFELHPYVANKCVKVGHSACRNGTYCAWREDRCDQQNKCRHPDYEAAWDACSNTGKVKGAAAERLPSEERAVAQCARLLAQYK